MCSYTISVNITPKETQGLKTPITKEDHYYHCSSKRERITFKKDSITISGTRGSKINTKFGLFTVRSTYQFSILKAFIYYLRCWGPFDIEKITFNVNNETSERLELGQEKLNNFFCNSIVFNFSKEKLEKIFEIENSKNCLVTALTYQIYGAESLESFERFANNWRCFNHIYNCVNGDTTDTNGIQRVLKDVEETNFSDLSDPIEISKEFISNLPKTRLLGWFFHKKKNLDSFMNLSGIGRMKDKELIKKMKELILPEFSDIKGDIDKNDNEHNNGEEQRVYKKISNLEGSEDYPFDYLLLTIAYTRYLRNKYFHGEYRSPQLIFKDNDIADELKKITEVLQKLNWVLLDRYYQKLYVENF
ncbi:hypothetical protein LMB54_09755 [Limosilactobacillus reuteri]|uniref:hypothetical protein n=1 Tax=Limosilactobacillus reuteri TaxID=1598 RepID=UPI001E41A122|nr:hypothetical protein [Limosilactobacillus reuteri]MCC4384081.1 hypothetical protein [Limosilactobacillus reuteri]MCC4420770.1 hypothetical protein [Limosilactobacillus reuteri]